jgi:hypothetical protein
MGKRKSRLATVPSPVADPMASAVKPHQLRTQSEIWHRFRLFAVENRSNQSEAFEVIVLVLHKYKEQPELIGPKIFEAFDKWHALAPSERLTYEDY